MESRQQKLHTN